MALNLVLCLLNVKRLHVVHVSTNDGHQVRINTGRSSKANYASSNNATGKRRSCRKPTADDPKTNCVNVKQNSSPNKKEICDQEGGGGGGGLLLGIFGGGVPWGSPNPDPISDKNMPFYTPIFRLGARFWKVP